FDRTHRAVFTYVYQLPWLREQRGFIGHALGGWELSGVTTFETGVPVTVANGADADGIGGNFDRPDFNPNGVPNTRAIPSLAVANVANPCGVTTAGTLYYTDAPSGAGSCVNPAEAMYIGILANSGRTGNLGRNTLRTPGTQLFDLNITKRTRITENTRLEFRTEFFNLFNHPQYGNPGTTVTFEPDPTVPVPAGSLPTVFRQTAASVSSFGVITTTRDPRIIQFGVKFNF
ncbi:MAG TPA: hypothetical protein VF634_12885, partial [Pyrinomonadaceae bacterium]